jgi:peptidoglycan/xylan/chitin deacetylase (PgdA/CDA1 family)
MVREQCGALSTVTFDDGHRSQFEIAAPLLHETGVKGLFFITTSLVGNRPTVMAWSELRELLNSRHSIGSHTHTHPMLTACSNSSLEEELTRSKDILEQSLGVEIVSISMPGGRVNARIVTACANAGYQRVYTSRPGENTLASAHSPAVIGRLMVRRATSDRLLGRFLSGDPRVARRLGIEYLLKTKVRELVGDAFYEWIWRKAVRSASLSPLQGKPFSIEPPTIDRR